MSAELLFLVLTRSEDDALNVRDVNIVQRQPEQSLVFVENAVIFIELRHRTNN